jgi:hypothetical protein
LDQDNARGGRIENIGGVEVVNQKEVVDNFIKAALFLGTEIIVKDTKTKTEQDFLIHMDKLIELWEALK